MVGMLSMQDWVVADGLSGLNYYYFFLFVGERGVGLLVAVDYTGLSLDARYARSLMYSASSPFACLRQVANSVTDPWMSQNTS